MFKPIAGNVVLKWLGEKEVKTNAGIILDAEVRKRSDIIEGEITALAEDVPEELGLGIGDRVFIKRGDCDELNLEEFSEAKHYLAKSGDILLAQETGEETNAD